MACLERAELAGEVGSVSTEGMECVDLLAAAADLSAEYPKIAHMIMCLRDAHSAHTDLATALDMVESSPDASNVAELHIWAQHAAMAMLQMAVILYVRHPIII